MQLTPFSCPSKVKFGEEEPSCHTFREQQHLPVSTGPCFSEDSYTTLPTYYTKRESPGEGSYTTFISFSPICFCSFSLYLNFQGGRVTMVLLENANFQDLTPSGSTLNPRNLIHLVIHRLHFEKHYLKGRKWFYERYNIKLMKVDLVNYKNILLNWKIKGMEK